MVTFSVDQTVRSDLRKSLITAQYYTDSKLNVLFMFICLKACLFASVSVISKKREK